MTFAPLGPTGRLSDGLLENEAEVMLENKVEVTASKRIAALLGPTLVALSITESMNLRIWFIPNLAPLVYLNGILLFVAGLSIVRVHNRWTGWPVLVTLTGWVAVLGGLFRMSAPALGQLQNSTALFAVNGVLFALGIFLTFKAYRREDGKTAV